MQEGFFKIFFVKVWHEVLIFKLRPYGIGELLNLMQVYLSSRQQRFVHNEEISSKEDVLASTPQGSALWQPTFALVLYK